MTSIRKTLEDFLRALHERNPEILGAIISRSDGLLIADNMNVRISKNIMAAMVASLVNVSKRASQELERGITRTIVIESSNGYIAIMEIKPNIYLAVILKQGANVGLTLLEMERSLQKIKEVL